jgi:hypothetical protein
VHPSASCALENFRALILRDHALHLHQQPIFGAFADRVLNEMNADAALGEFFENHLLVHVAACESIGTIDVDYVD